jgi:NAD(P)-dependent dehydrogenase (short-subunit alcohol dehydrogenase family)
MIFDKSTTYAYGGQLAFDPATPENCRVSDPSSRPVPGSNKRPGRTLAVIIGAGGMGIAAANRLGQRHRLLLVDIDAQRLAEREKELRAAGHDPEIFACDITAPQQMQALSDRAAALGPLGVLAHVAGLSPSMADWRTILSVNLTGAHLVEAAMLPLAVPGTAAIFIASLAGHMAAPAPEIIAILEQPRDPAFLERIEIAAGPVSTTLAYQLSKFALIRYCQHRAPAWGKQGARIVSLSPGLIATPMGALEFENQPMKYDLLEKTPLRREGTMLEIADAIDFLASDRASFISGTDLLVDGGIRAALTAPA